jgi:hypothetical protein
MKHTLAPTAAREGLLGFYPSYREVPWDNLLSHAKTTLDIVVYYWDKWTNQHILTLQRLLKNPEAKIRFFFADESDPRVLSEILRLFPANQAEELKSKIRHTYEPLGTTPQVEVYRVPHLLNYSMQCMDGKILVLSLFEMYRQQQVDSPAIVIDLTKEPNLKKFYQKELDGLIKSGKR